jgi:hypothetical protein
LITLYQLHWSHYVEKVSWALDYKGIDWRAVEVAAGRLGAVNWLPASMRDDQISLKEVPTVPTARNDQQPVGRWPVITGTVWYSRLVLTSGLARTRYP